MTCGSASPSLLDIPTEIQALILEQLDNVATLKDVMLTCKALHQTCIRFPLIKATIWTNKISSDVLPWSIAALTTGRKRRQWFPYVHPWHALKPFLDNRRDFVTSTLSSLPMAAYGELIRLHSVMEWLFAEFIETTVANVDSVDGYSYYNKHPLTPSEKSRVYRAFYRLQVYCNVFRFARENDDTAEKLSLFFDCESPWVNEQLVIARQILYKDIGQFSMVVPRLKNTQEAKKLLADSPNWGFIAGELKDAGPDYMYPLTRAKSPRSLVKRILKIHSQFGLDVLSSLDVGTSQIQPLFEYSAEEMDDMRRSNSPCDLDSGPFEAWFALHTFQRHSRMCALFEMMHPRDMGYVMWDKERLDRDRFLEKCQQKWETDKRFTPMTDGRTQDFPLVTRYPRWRDAPGDYNWYGDEVPANE